MIKNFLKIIIKATKPWVWRVAEAYDIKINRPGVPWGRHKVIFIEGQSVVGKSIPKSTHFNTASGTITIDENVVFGENVQLLTGMHMNIEEARKKNKPLHYVPESGRDIFVGKGTFIGTGAIVVGPVKIGEYCIVGAGAIVTKDIPSYGVVYSSSAQFKRFQS